MLSFRLTNQRIWVVGLFETLYGAAQNRGVYAAYNAERVVQVGGEVPWACWLQVLLVLQATEVVPRALSQISSRTICLSNLARFGLMMIPVGVAGLVELVRNRKVDDRVRAWVYPVHTRIGTVALASVSLSHILMMLQTPWQSSGALASMVVSQWLDHSHDSDDRVRQAVRLSFLILVAGRGWLGGNRWEKAFSTAHIIVEGLEFLPEMGDLPQVTDRDNGEITVQELEEELPDFRIDRSHFLSNTRLELPEATPSASLDLLVHSFCEARWDRRARRLLKAQVKGDPRWRDEMVTTYEPLDYVAEGLRRYVKGIKERSIPEGPPRDYGRITRLAQLLAELLPKLSDESRQELLIKLGLAAWMCGDEWQRTSEELYCDYGSKTKQAWVGEQYLYRLARLRGRLLRQLASDSQRSPNGPWKHSPLVIAPVNLHEWHSIVVAFPELGLPGLERARNDQLANTSRLGRLWTRWVYGDLVERLGQIYTPEYVFRATKEMIEKGVLTPREMGQWFGTKLQDIRYLNRVYNREVIDDRAIWLFAWKAGGLCPVA